MSRQLKNTPCRQTLYARKIRDRLLLALGGRCEKCGATEALEFDHIHGVHYAHSRLSYSARLKRYEREHELGLLRLLCSDCNKKERKTNDNGRWVPTAEAVSGLIPLTRDMPF